MSEKLCPACKQWPQNCTCVHGQAYCSNCDALQTENERLKALDEGDRKELFRYTEFRKIRAERDRLKAENAELKEAYDEASAIAKKWIARGDSLTQEVKRLREALEAIKLMVDAQARDEGLWSVPLEGLQPIAEAYLQQELRRLHACVEHYTEALGAEGTKGNQ